MLAGEGIGPLLLGSVRPVIILPETLLAETHTLRLRMILAHELAHMRQRDLYWGWVAMAAEALFFFHPLVRLGVREWQLAQEMACDTLVIRAVNASEADYGAMLVAVTAETSAIHRPIPLAAGASESYRSLQQRLLVLLNRRRLRRRQAIILGLFIAIIAVVFLLPWRSRTSSMSKTAKQADKALSTGQLSSSPLAENTQHADGDQSTRRSHTPAVKITENADGSLTVAEGHGIFVTITGGHDIVYFKKDAAGHEHQLYKVTRGGGDKLSAAVNTGDATLTWALLQSDPGVIDIDVCGEFARSLRNPAQHICDAQDVR